jgi:hypothetical protein
MNKDKIKQIKSLIDSLSESSLQIWAQHLWEYLFCKDLNRGDPGFDAKYQIIDELWNHLEKTYNKKTGLPGDWVRTFCSMRKFNKYPWLEYSKDVELEILDDRGFTVKVVKHKTSYIDNSFLHLRTACGKYSLKEGRAAGYLNGNSKEKSRLTALSMVKTQYDAGII